MKLSLSFVAALLAPALVLAPISTFALPNPTRQAPTTLSPFDGDWYCNNAWPDGGLVRLSFFFTGYCEEEWGQCFLRALRGKALIVHNWQAWQRDDGWWQVDFSTTAGLAWQANNAIEEITGKWRGCWPNW